MAETGQRDAQAAVVAEQLGLAEQLDDDHCRAIALGEQGCLLAVTGELTACIDVSTRARALAERVGEPGLVLMSGADTGYALQVLGRYDEAAELLRATATLARELGRGDVEIVALNRLNTVARAQHRVTERLACFDRAIEVAEQTGNLRLLAALRGNLGAAETRWGQFDRAMALITGALATQRAIGDRGSEGYSLWQLMTLHELLGDLGAALRAGEQALSLAVDVRDRGMESGVLIAAAMLAVKHGALDKAETWLARYETLGSTTAGTDRPAPATLLPRAMLARARGQTDQAAALILDWMGWLERDASSLKGTECQQLWQACTVLRHCALQPAYGQVLERAWLLLQNECAELPESRRAAFTHEVPYNRDIAEAWASLDHGGNRAL